VCICMHMHMCVSIYIYVHVFAVSVACTLEQVFWALVHGQVCTLYRCVFTPTYTSATHSLQVVYICIYLCICVYPCIFIWMRMCVYDIA